MTPVRWFCTVCLLFAALGSSRQTAAQKVLAASVNGKPIFKSDVERKITGSLGDRPLDPAAANRLKAATLAQLVKRELILLYLQETKQAPSNSDLELAMEQFKKSLSQQNLTLPDYLQSIDRTEAEVRHSLAWRIGWRNFLNRQLTEENLARFFEQHQADFDGRQVHAAHILFPLEDDKPETLKNVLAQATKVRQEIAEGKLTFDQGAQMYSQAPTAKEGGNIGLISRREPMPEVFSAAAFALKEGEVSSPLRSRFGVHLILCRKIEPGDKTWQDVRPELEIAASRFLFDWAAEQGGKTAKVEFSGKVPYFDSASGELKTP